MRLGQTFITGAQIFTTLFCKTFNILISQSRYYLKIIEFLLKSFLERAIQIFIIAAIEQSFSQTFYFSIKTQVATQIEIVYDPWLNKIKDFSRIRTENRVRPGHIYSV